MFRASHLELDKAPCKGEESESEQRLVVSGAGLRWEYRMSRGTLRDNTCSPEVCAPVMSHSGLEQSRGPMRRAQDLGR